MKAYTLGKSLILSARKKVVKTMRGNKAAKEIKTVCPKILSTNVSQKSHLISRQNVCGKKLLHSDFVLQTDESTKCSSSHLFNSWMKIKLSISLFFTNVFTILNGYLYKQQVSWKLSIGIWTDGAPNMLGCVNGLTAFVKEQSENVVNTHCCLHREIFISLLLIRS